MVDWQKLLENYGLPITILFAVAYFLRKDLLLPWRDRWLARALVFFDRLEIILDQATKRDIAVAKTLEIIDERLKTLEVSACKEMKQP